MIPKIIHFCWLSNDPYPAKIRACMDSWKKIMPDYTIKHWNRKNFDVATAPPYVQEAIKARKWAFAADYIRMYALYMEGGIYLDSDVKVLKPFDEFLHHSFFSSMEYHPTQVEKTGSSRLINAEGKRIADAYVSGIQIQAAVMGAEAGCPFLADVMQWYHQHNFIQPDGTLSVDILAPYIYARIAEKYGFLYVDKDQDLQGNMKIYRSEIFAGNKHEVTAASYAIHWCAHSWHPSIKEKLYKLLGLKTH